MTPEQQAAMRQALEALEYANTGNRRPEVLGRAITAIREALAEQQQEPVAFYIYKPTLPRGNLGSVSDGDLPWVYDQDPSSGFSARMLVTPITSPPAQQQEPVVWMYVNKSTHETKFQKHMRDFVDHGLWAEVPLYGEPLANQELNCVCGAVWQGDELVHLPRKPASKPWVGLTDEEISKMPAWIYSPDQDGMTAEEGLEVFARAIEAKLKEKNT